MLNGTGQVKESTRQQVFAAMEELGYRPNFVMTIGDDQLLPVRFGLPGGLLKEAAKVKAIEG